MGDGWSRKTEGLGGAGSMRPRNSSGVAAMMGCLLMASVNILDLDWRYHLVLHPFHVKPPSSPISSCWNHRSFTFQKVGLINQQQLHISINKKGLFEKEYVHLGVAAILLSQSDRKMQFVS